MIASVRSVRWAPMAVLALIGLLAFTAAAEAVPPTLNSSGLTPQQCYRRDSDCTQFCGEVTGDMRYECFSICDRMLDRCLTTGEWSDSLEADPDTGKPPVKGNQLSALLLRMLMVLTDRDGDRAITPSEIQTLKNNVFEKDGGKKGDPSQSKPR